MRRRRIPTNEKKNNGRQRKKIVYRILFAQVPKGKFNATLVSVLRALLFALNLQGKNRKEEEEKIKKKKLAGEWAK